MTRDEILAMKAGPKLDVLVATEIMGAKWIKEEEFGVHYERLYLSSEEHAIQVTNLDKSYGWHTDYLPKYSTDISAAWQLVMKMTHETCPYVGVASEEMRGLFPSVVEKQFGVRSTSYYCTMKVFPGGWAAVEFTEITRLFAPNKPSGWVGIDWDMFLPEAICKAALLAKLERVE